MSAISENSDQLKAFDLLVKMLQESLVLTARATHQGGVRSTAFRAALERYAGIYGIASYQSIPLVHLFESAINGEALLIYEYQHAASLLEAENVLKDSYLEKALTYKKRIEELFNAARRTHNLLINTSYPYIMPYRVFFISPYSKEVERLLVMHEDSFVLWNQDIVAIIPENGVEKFKGKASETFLLSYDADSLVNRSSEESELHKLWTGQLKAARQSVHLAHAGEAFPHHINRCLLHQNTILLNLLPRLKNEHSKARDYLAPFVDASVKEFQKHLLENPSWIPEDFIETKDNKNTFISREKKIDAHVRHWIEKMEKNDAAGLHSQFKAVLEASCLVSN